jgi:hypothetical protein
MFIQALDTSAVIISFINININVCLFFTIQLLVIKFSLRRIINNH